MNIKMFRIAWRSLLTYNEGHGNFLYTEQEATQKIEWLNTRHTGTIHHWVEWE
jgi:hypothetical protein